MKLLEAYQLFAEYVVHKNYTLKNWKSLSNKTKTEIKKRDKNKAVWKVVHGHKRGEIGKTVYKKNEYTTLEKANARHSAIMMH